MIRSYSNVTPLQWELGNCSGRTWYGHWKVLPSRSIMRDCHHNNYNNITPPQLPVIAHLKASIMCKGKKTTARLLVITTLVEWKWIEVVTHNQIRYLWVSNLWMHCWSVLCRVSLLSEEGPTGVRSKHGKIRCIWRLFAHKYVWCTRTTFTSRDGLFINYYPANTDIILSKNAKYIGSYWERGRDDKHSVSRTSPLT